MLHSFLESAQFEFAQALPMIIIAMSGTIGFFISRAFKSTDRMSERVDLLREDMGKFKMVNDAQWRNIEELKSDVKALRDRIYEVRK
jgi:hypothetical protein